MIVDTRRVDSGTVIETDLCIIGAGAAGITAALEFADSQVQICVLESGGFKYDGKTQSLYDGEAAGRPYELDTTRTRYFGGSTNCWGGWCKRLDRIDFEQRDWVPHSGWPFTREDLDPFYDRAGAICGLPAVEADLSDWTASLADMHIQSLPIAGDRIAQKVSQVTPNRLFGEVYRDRIAAASNLCVFLYANVTNIDAAPTGEAVRHVEVKTLSGVELTVVAKYYILATGGIENARLLLLSNNVHTAGLGNQNDLVGRFFMEHPLVRAGRFEPSEQAPPTEAYDVRYAYFNLPVVLHLHLAESTLREERLQNFKAYIDAVYAGEDSPVMKDARQLFMALKRRNLAAKLLKNVASCALHVPSVSGAVLARLFHPAWLFRKLQLSNVVEPAPNPDSRVLLSSRRDALGLNRVSLDWRLSSSDLRTMRRAQEILSQELEASGLGRIQTEPHCNFESWPQSTEWVWHHMGTTRMHEDPKKGVVNPDGRVHGLANLFVAGSSVFPTASSDTPTLTIVALSLRLADHIKGRFASV